MNEAGLIERRANTAPVTPLSFLARTAAVYPDATAIIHGDDRISWHTFETRVHRLAAGLSAHEIGKGDVVALLAPNTPAFLETAFAVPLIGAVLLPLNIRLDPKTIAYCLAHGEAKMVLVDRELGPLLHRALSACSTRPTVARIDDPLAPEADCEADIAYDVLFDHAPTALAPPDDDWSSFALLYTSGTTGQPKGVVYSHRGVATTATSNAIDWDMAHFPAYLWTLPMFHCMGWCFPYTVAMLAGTNICLRRVTPESVLDAIRRHSVTHLCGAPIVMQMLIEGARRTGFRAERTVRMMTAAAPPPASVIERLEAIGVDVTHVYGLTEVYGPCVVSAWNSAWDALSATERALKKARQGVAYTLQEPISVRDPETFQEVPRDGQTVGEIMLRGNIVMKGYLKDEAATQKAFSGGYFHTGDLAVWHTDGYVEIKDRAKDIIISGGENISSIEVENTLYAHPAVSAAAVVAMPDETWGETPCAFVEVAAGATAAEDELIAWCRERIAPYKSPKRVVFESLPKTSTGKIQKFALRERARSIAAADPTGPR